MYFGHTENILIWIISQSFHNFHCFFSVFHKKPTVIRVVFGHYPLIPLWEILSTKLLCATT